MPDDGSETPPDTGDTSDYKAMYEAMKADNDKISGQYKSLQTKHNTTAKERKSESSAMGDQMKAMQETIDSLTNKNETDEKEFLMSQLTQLDKKIAEAEKDSDISTLKTVLRILKASKGSEFPAHSTPDTGKEKKDVKTGAKNWDFAKGEWIKT